MANPKELELIGQGVDVWNKWMMEVYRGSPDLSGANLSAITLGYANFEATNLEGVNFSGTNLMMANLKGAILKGANLTGAFLQGADITYTDLSDTVMDNAVMGGTIIGSNDLSQARGLETVRHTIPSVIGLDTLYRSRGEIPELFLRGCGVPEDFITYMHSLTAAGKPIQFYSCFISYSNKNQEFADRLYADLQSKGVRCWFAPEDMKIGDKIRDRIDESIRLRDKLLLILTESSISSEWVEHEVESALEEEKQRGRTILFPIRLDDAVMESHKAWAALIRRTRHIGDFSRWKEHDSYSKAFDRLLRDLKAEEKLFVWLNELLGCPSNESFIVDLLHGEAPHIVLCIE